MQTSRYTSAYGPNVEQILVSAYRVIKGKVPARVRKELAAAVKAGVLGRLAKDGLKPEVYFHPDHKNGAVELQKREAEYSIRCIANVLAVKPIEQRIDEALTYLNSKAAGADAQTPSPPTGDDNV